MGLPSPLYTLIADTIIIVHKIVAVIAELKKISYEIIAVVAFAHRGARKHVSLCASNERHSLWDSPLLWGYTLIVDTTHT